MLPFVSIHLKEVCNFAPKFLLKNGNVRFRLVNGKHVPQGISLINLPKSLMYLKAIILNTRDNMQVPRSLQCKNYGIFLKNKIIYCAFIMNNSTESDLTLGTFSSNFLANLGTCSENDLLTKGWHHNLHVFQDVYPKSNKVKSSLSYSAQFIVRTQPSLLNFHFVLWNFFCSSITGRNSDGVATWCIAAFAFLYMKIQWAFVPILYIFQYVQLTNRTFTSNCHLLFLWWPFTILGGQWYLRMTIPMGFKARLETLSPFLYPRS